MIIPHIKLVMKTSCAYNTNKIRNKHECDNFKGTGWSFSSLHQGIIDLNKIVMKIYTVINRTCTVKR